MDEQNEGNQDQPESQPKEDSNGMEAKLDNIGKDIEAGLKDMEKDMESSFNDFGY